MCSFVSRFSQSYMCFLELSMLKLLIEGMDIAMCCQPGTRVSNHSNSIEQIFTLIYVLFRISNDEIVNGRYKYDHVALSTRN